MKRQSSALLETRIVSSFGSSSPPRFATARIPVRMRGAGILVLALLPLLPPHPAGARDGPDPRELPGLNRRILEGAQQWLRRGFRYDTAYHALEFPGGDVPIDRGACTDLVVRALRHAGIDLQPLIRADRQARPAAYPAQPVDPNLDHRLTAMQLRFFRRHARALTTSVEPGRLGEWLPGDLVFFGRRRPWHVAIIADRRAPTGVPYVIDSHPKGGGVSDRFLLTRWGPILAHFRLDESLDPDGG